MSWFIDTIGSITASTRTSTIAPIVTISDLTAGQHTLTITVTGRQDSQASSNVVVVDAFDIQPGTTVSHWQETNPDMGFSAGWTKSSIAQNFSGTGVSRCWSRTPAG